MAYIKSENVYIYPTGNRKNGTYIYNPAAKLNTEFNITNQIAQLITANPNRCFVIDYDNTTNAEVLKLCMVGYYIELKYKLEGSSKYAVLYVKNTVDSGAYVNQNIYEIYNNNSQSTDLDETIQGESGEESKFVGLEIVDSEPNSGYYLQIWDGEKIPANSYLKFNANDINGVSISGINEPLKDSVLAKRNPTGEGTLTIDVLHLVGGYDYDDYPSDLNVDGGGVIGASLRVNDHLVVGEDPQQSLGNVSILTDGDVYVKGNFFSDGNIGTDNDIEAVNGAITGDELIALSSVKTLYINNDDYDSAIRFNDKGITIYGENGDNVNLNMEQQTAGATITLPDSNGTLVLDSNTLTSNCVVLGDGGHKVKTSSDIMIVSDGISVSKKINSNGGLSILQGNIELLNPTSSANKISFVSGKSQGQSATTYYTSIEPSTTTSDVRIYLPTSNGTLATREYVQSRELYNHSIRITFKNATYTQNNGYVYYDATGFITFNIVSPYSQDVTSFYTLGQLYKDSFQIYSVASNSGIDCQGRFNYATAGGSSSFGIAILGRIECYGYTGGYSDYCLGIYTKGNDSFFSGIDEYPVFVGYFSTLDSGQYSKFTITDNKKQIL